MNMDLVRKQIDERFSAVMQARPDRVGQKLESFIQWSARDVHRQCATVAHLAEPMVVIRSLFEMDELKKLLDTIAHPLCGLSGEDLTRIVIVSEALLATYGLDSTAYIEEMTRKFRGMPHPTGDMVRGTILLAVGMSSVLGGWPTRIAAA
ncbi:MAG: hypothetical protein ACXVGA_04395 [Mycobacteriaceae bacterium]